MTRRELLLGFVGTGLVALLGGATFLLAHDNYGPWIIEVLQSYLPGHTFDPEGLARYIREYTAKKNGETALKLETYALAEQLFDPTWIAPAAIAEKVAEEERRIVTGFLMGSDFFYDDPPPRTITYQGRDGACYNPFATF